MANLQNAANATADRLKVVIGADDAWGFARVNYTANKLTAPHRLASVGATPVAHVVTGWDIGIEIEFTEVTQALHEKFFGTGASAPRNFAAVGVVEQGESVVISDPKDSGNTYALTHPRTVWTSVSTERDGDGQGVITVTGKVLADPATGVIARVGPAA
jgi:hypothetical protein